MSPWAAPRRCSIMGCPEFVTRVGRCHLHQPVDARPNSDARGYGSKWRQVRAIALKRDPICTAPNCNERSTDVDHIVSRANGGSDHSSNLRGLCHRCHSRKTVHEDGGLGR